MKGKTAKEPILASLMFSNSNNEISPGRKKQILKTPAGSRSQHTLTVNKKRRKEHFDAEPKKVKREKSVSISEEKEDENGDEMVSILMKLPIKSAERNREKKECKKRGKSPQKRQEKASPKRNKIKPVVTPLTPVVKKRNESRRITPVRLSETFEREVKKVRAAVFPGNNDEAVAAPTAVEYDEESSGSNVPWIIHLPEPHPIAEAVVDDRENEINLKTKLLCELARRQKEIYKKKSELEMEIILLRNKVDFLNQNIHFTMEPSATSGTSFLSPTFRVL